MESRTIGYGVTAFVALLLAVGVLAIKDNVTLTPPPPPLPPPPIPIPAHDPGIRGGDAGAGEPLPGLSDPLQKLFVASQKAFVETEKVDDGLGPRMNLDSCGGCHAQPGIGGSSPVPNPQFSFFKDKLEVLKTNTLPSFITDKGPTREARFKLFRYATTGPDGGVHDLFTIAGLKGAENCKIKQDDFEAELGLNNVIFRIPTPAFGAGLIEQIPDTVIRDNINADPDKKKGMGIRYPSKLNFVISANTITGLPNINGNDGTIARFGWKAQNKSLLIFSGEAYNVEMGISNELFQTEREEDPNCQGKRTPNDTTADPDRIPEKDADEFTKQLVILSDMEKFASFMRLLAPPVPSSDSPGGSKSIANGKTLFINKVGCALCHTPMLKTGDSKIEQLRNKDVHLWSDLAIHQMGPNLDDGISQGQAKGNEFRTAPLWGLGKRIFFLHDGRTDDLVKAIEEHRSLDTRSFRCRVLSFFGLSRLCGPDDGTVASEANAIVDKYNNLPDTEKQDLLNFLRSL